MLAQKIGDEELRKSFLSAPQVRRVLGHNQDGAQVDTVAWKGWTGASL
jgi:hypothetical protein